MQKKYIVLERWEQSYPDPIILIQGDEVVADLSVTDPDPEWVDWIWCLAGEKGSGWVPDRILEKTEPLSGEKYKSLVLEDYSANELTVDKGETVVGEKILNGWLWCYKTDSSIGGWILTRNIKEIL